MPSAAVGRREIETHSSDETIARGREIGAGLKGIAAGAGAAREDDVTSPTFTLVHKYEGRARVYHVDLYRVDDFRDLETLGLEDVFTEKAIVIVEWPDRLKLRTDWPVLRIGLEHVSEDVRKIVMQDG
jgi:tRNA threonylcarbamoyladenosine biosynthesis protein TsaE